MAVEPDPLRRARDLVRAETPTDWQSVSDAVRARMRSVVSPAEPIRVVGAGDEHGSVTRISSRVLRARLRHLLQARPTHAPLSIRLTIEDERLVAIEIELVNAYGHDLEPLVATLRAEVRALAEELVGEAPERVDIHVADVVEGDPNIT